MSEFLGMPGARPSKRQPYVVATVVRAQRPTSAKAGDRALVRADGSIEGFVGGHCATDTVRTQSLRLLESGRATLLKITPSAVEPHEEEGLVEVGQPCLSGGTLEIFLQPVLPPPLMRVYGDSPIARAFADVGTALGYEMTTFGQPDSGTRAVLVASHGVNEVSMLRAAVAARVPYIGLIASRKRARAVLAEVEGGEIVHAPAGLDLGARTPGAVALSVHAQIVSLGVADRLFG
ncbi:XdhC family protein [Nonomuraea soli]|uniref:Xanthine dehydrogenase accessory factor n=1 Tax=Nonomuraea soli TaxID=1032476 RepID=A0A7W0CG96_9ACTN|nr:XdhC family protein [Nonomuraea soli]MBA2890625.1 xanthine dehydrogenase accessory factor [Nonomuraea soli]